MFSTPGKRRSSSAEFAGRSSHTPQRRLGTPHTAVSKQSRCDVKSWQSRSPASWSVRSVATPLRVEAYFSMQEESLVPAAPSKPSAPSAPTYKPPANLKDNPEGCSLPPDPFGQGWSLPPGPENPPRHGYAASAALKLSNLRCSALPSPTQLGNTMRAFCSPSRQSRDQIGYSPVRPRRPLFAERSPKVPEEGDLHNVTSVSSIVAIDTQEDLDLEAHGTSLTPPQESPSTSQSQCRLSDPVWGELEFLGRGPTRWQAICFGMCPCLMIPFRGKCCAVKNQTLASPSNAKKSWNRFVFSFSIAFCVLQVIAFLGTVVYAGGFMPSSENPGWGPYPYYLNLLGAKNAALILAEGEWWRLVTPVLLHSNVGHLLVNVLIQARVAVSMENHWGHSRWLVVYVCAGAYASLASCVFLPDSLSVGSSGAICGVLGAGVLYMAVMWRQLRDEVDRNVQICLFAATIIVMAILSVLPMVDFAAHAGGFVSGLLLAMVLFAECLEKENTKIADRIRSVGCVLLATLVTLTLAYFVWKVEPDPKLLSICRPSDC